MSLERCESLSLSGSRAALSRENSGASLGSNSGKSSKSIPRFGIPNSSSSPIATCPSSPSGGTLNKPGQVKASANPRALGAVNGSKAALIVSQQLQGPKLLHQIFGHSRDQKYQCQPPSIRTDISSSNNCCYQQQAWERHYYGHKAGHEGCQQPCERTGNRQYIRQTHERFRRFRQRE
ncbi:hypothetical protein E3U43_015027 [Larimichthys crocea]|uniref:Uncharacterized protein n=1 Tax=Larimichthys crocea TaxID=215358 RepID=A0ACD3RPG6_LARCR|nr:hypothetical protein E3U43_015027 [Larimichthys crocea]